MTRQTSFQMDEDTEALIAFLKDRGFGNNTNILREAVKRMAAEEQRGKTYTSKRIEYATDNWGREDVTHLEILWNGETLRVDISDKAVTLAGPQFELSDTQYLNKVTLNAV